MTTAVRPEEHASRRTELNHAVNSVESAASWFCGTALRWWCRSWSRDTTRPATAAVVVMPVTCAVSPISNSSTGCHLAGRDWHHTAGSTRTPLCWPAWNGRGRRPRDACRPGTTRLPNDDSRSTSTASSTISSPCSAVANTGHRVRAGETLGGPDRRARRLGGRRGTTTASCSPVRTANSCVPRLSRSRTDGSSTVPDYPRSGRTTCATHTPASPWPPASTSRSSVTASGHRPPPSPETCTRTSSRR